MIESSNERDLHDRLSIIESMITEGRRQTESWGWSFLLWGVAYLVAMAWSRWNGSSLAWPVTVVATVVLMALKLTWEARRTAPEDPTRAREGRAGTTVSRAISSVWIAMGISLFLLLTFLGSSGRFDWHLFVAIVGSMLGIANAASSLILRWKLQFGCAIVWWSAAAAACFGTYTQTTAAFLIAILLCQIVFGLYCMAGERERRRHPGVLHA